MRKLCLILLLLPFIAHSQMPTGLPQQFRYNYYRFYGYTQSDSGYLYTSRLDTNWHPATSSAVIFYNNSYWYYANGKWNNFAASTIFDTTVVSTKSYRQKAVDSLNLNIGKKVDTSSAVNAGYGLTGGGKLTTSRTVTADSTLLSTKSWRQKAVDSLNTTVVHINGYENLKGIKAVTPAITSTTDTFAVKIAPTFTGGANNVTMDALVLSNSVASGGFTGVSGRALYVKSGSALFNGNDFHNGYIVCSILKCNYSLTDTPSSPRSSITFFDSTGTVGIMKLWSLTGNVNIGDTIARSNKLYVNGDIRTTGGATIGGNASVSGTSTFYGNVSLTQGVLFNYRTATSNYTVATTDYTVNVTSGAPTITLPLAATAGSGKVFIIKRTSGSTVSVAVSGSDTIDGSASYSLSTSNSCIQVMSDGISTYIIIGKI
jgi:hypothetical protein